MIFNKGNKMKKERHTEQKEIVESLKKNFQIKTFGCIAGILMKK